MERSLRVGLFLSVLLSAWFLLKSAIEKPPPPTQKSLQVDLIIKERQIAALQKEIYDLRLENDKLKSQIAAETSHPEVGTNVPDEIERAMLFDAVRGRQLQFLHSPRPDARMTPQWMLERELHFNVNPLDRPPVFVPDEQQRRGDQTPG